MSVPRYQIIYPEYLFRGIVNSKNVAPPDDHWAEGVICRDDSGKLFIINRKAGEGVYGLAEIYTDTLGVSGGFKDGGRHDIFEGDIVRISGFVRGDAENDRTDGEDTANAYPDGFAPKGFGEDEEPEIPEREVFEDVPDGAQAVSELKGVVFMSGGIFYVQFYDEISCTLSAVPLYMYFGCDMLPAENTAVKIIGNLYDDEELYADVLHLNVQSECINKM